MFEPELLQEIDELKLRLRNVAELGKKMRDAQKDYFKNKRGPDAKAKLVRSKNMEVQFDMMLNRI